MQRLEQVSASFASRLAMLLNLKMAGLMKNQGDIQEGGTALAFKIVHNTGEVTAAGADSVNTVASEIGGNAAVVGEVAVVEADEDVG